MGQLNIKDPTLIAQAKELAKLRGTSVTGALREAVQVKLEAERQRHQTDTKRQVDEILELARQIRDSGDGPLMTNEELDDFLYDPDTGLPR